ncbi:hypothetical protein BJV74DRAFT_891090 [Russula compacta]|nr:hypothetical protein BJV74DRAFT_891090 [Russula compacta]
MDTQFKTDGAYGMRDDRIIDLRNIRRAKPPALYVTQEPISTPVTPATANPTMTSGSILQRRQMGMHSKCPSESFVSGCTKPASLDLAIDGSTGPLLLYAPNIDARVGKGSVDPKSGSDLAQAAGEVAYYSAWLEGQVEAQKAKIHAMSLEYSIPIPNLDLKPFEFPPIPRSAGNAVSTNVAAAIMKETKNRNSLQDELVIPAVPPAPRLQAAQPVPGLWQPQGTPSTVQTPATGPFSAHGPMAPRPPPLELESIPMAPAGVVTQHSQVTTTAPKKEDMAYKTTPCKHFTLNNGYCPWGDECGFIHDPHLAWMPAIERTSGRPTPSSAALAYPAKPGSATPHHPNGNMVVPQRRESTVPPAKGHPDAQLLPMQQPPPPPPTPRPAAETLVIPHEEAYLSAKRHHHPTTPSADMFCMAPQSPAVRLRRPSEAGPHDDQRLVPCGRDLGGAAYQRRARRVSIAVQKLDAALKTQAKGPARGHARGKSLNL